MDDCKLKNCWCKNTPRQYEACYESVLPILENILRLDEKINEIHKRLERMENEKDISNGCTITDRV